jgi:hypothetical protein
MNQHRLRIGFWKLQSAVLSAGFTVVAGCGGIVESQPKPAADDLPVPFAEPSATAVPPAPPTPLAPPVPQLRGEWLTPKGVRVYDFAVDATGIYLSTLDADSFAKIQSCPAGAGCTTAAAATTIYASPEPAEPSAITIVGDLFFSESLKSANSAAVLKRVALPAVGAVPGGAVPVSVVNTKPLFNVRALAGWGTNLTVRYAWGSLLSPSYYLVNPTTGATSELGGPNTGISVRNNTELYQQRNGSPSLSVWTNSAGSVSNRDIPEIRLSSPIHSEFQLLAALPNRLIVDRATVGILSCPYGESVLCKTSIPVKVNSASPYSELRVHDGILYGRSSTPDRKPQLVACAVATFETTGACAWNAVWTADENTDSPNGKLISTPSGLYGLFGGRVIRLRP